MSNGQPLLEAIDLRKQYGGVTAVRRGTLTLEAGEVHAVVGDNGAGKSTMLKMLSGATQPSSGWIRIDGQAVELATPKAAQAHGLSTVFQDLALINHLDCVENMFLGREIYRRGPLGWLGVLDNQAMRKQARRHVSRLKVGIKSMSQDVRDMSGGQRQAVAVARAAAFGTKIIVLDEPTAALGVRESKAVLDLICEMRDQGLSVIMISHNLQDVRSIADRVTVMRLGETMRTRTVADTSMNDLVGLITGAQVDSEVAA
jgi:simple sugar transport system ATP-binding protein